MGGRDKGLVQVGGRPLIEAVTERLGDQVDELVISCNRNYDEYRRYGKPVPDREAGFPGPLMGVLSASAQVGSDYCLIVPCDLPALPRDLRARLEAELGDHDIAVAHDGDRLQVLVFLARKASLTDIEDYLKYGDNSVKGWIAKLDAVTVDFSDCPGSFKNVNRLDPPGEN